MFFLLEFCTESCMDLYFKYSLYNSSKSAISDYSAIFDRFQIMVGLKENAKARQVGFLSGTLREGSVYLLAKWLKFFELCDIAVISLNLYYPHPHFHRHAQMVSLHREKVSLVEFKTYLSYNY